MASRTLLQSTIYRDFKMPISMDSSTSPSNPGKIRKFTTRKNYLRQKLLKTLKKPYPNSLFFELPHQSPVVSPNESSPEENLIFSLEHCAVGSGEEIEELEIQEVRVAEITKSVEVMENSVSDFSKGSFLKFGLWLLGAFVFQTICAVWVLGSADIFNDNGNTSNGKDKTGILDVGLKERAKSRVKLVLNGNKGLETGEMVYWNEDDMEKKIEEIQIMAREARKREGLERENNAFERDDNVEEDEEVDFGKNGIEKEVSDQLVKLSSRFGKVQEKLSVSFIDNVKKGDGKRDEAVKDELDKKEGHVDLIFKKKYKFRGSLSRHTDKPKGFNDSDNFSSPKEVIKDGGSQVLMNGDIFRGSMETDSVGNQSMEASKSLGTAEKKLVERQKRKPGKRLDLVGSESNGTSP